MGVRNNLEIEFVRSSKARKEDIVKKNAHIEKTGLIYILSAMETCITYRPWHNKISNKTYLKGDQSKCLHYYFYFNDPDLGLGYVRVPTWCPFQLQVYFNGHNLLANKLKSKNIDFHMIDNAFDHIEDFDKAQKLSNALDMNKLMKKLSWLAEIYWPVHTEFGQTYHWSIMQQE